MKQSTGLLDKDLSRGVRGVGRQGSIMRVWNTSEGNGALGLALTSAQPAELREG